MNRWGYALRDAHAWILSHYWSRLTALYMLFYQHQRKISSNKFGSYSNWSLSDGQFSHFNSFWLLLITDQLQLFRKTKHVWIYYLEQNGKSGLRFVSGMYSADNQSESTDWLMTNTGHWSKDSPEEESPSYAYGSHFSEYRLTAVRWPFLKRNESFETNNLWAHELFEFPGASGHLQGNGSF